MRPQCRVGAVPPPDPASSAVASATMPATPTMAAEAGMLCETVAAMVLVAMIPAAMVPAAPAAIVKIERAIDRIVGVSIVAVRGSAIIRLRRACGQEKSDADQERYRFRDCSTALHCSLHSFEVTDLEGHASALQPCRCRCEVHGANAMYSQGYAYSALSKPLSTGLSAEAVASLDGGTKRRA